jgi:hypothetical protein
VIPFLDLPVRDPIIMGGHWMLKIVGAIPAPKNRLIAGKSPFNQLLLLNFNIGQHS